ncbi:VWA domain-containing protein [Candidatus Uhrbacteria bacterium]|nr:VWA domain-containing protein [Candidatus Uhrbacteria bacterium]
MAVCVVFSFAPLAQAAYGEQCVQPAYNIVFVVDTSPSMERTHNAIEDAYASRWWIFADESVRMGIVTVSQEGKTDFNPSIYSELVAFTDFAFSFRSATREWRGFRTEPTFEAVSDLATGELPFTWDEEAERVIVLFTDEPLQSDSGLEECIDLGAELCSDLSGTGDHFIVVTPSEHAEDYGSCALVAGNPRQGVEQITKLMCDGNRLTPGQRALNCENW